MESNSIVSASDPARRFMGASRMSRLTILYRGINEAVKSQSQPGEDEKSSTGSAIKAVSTSITPPRGLLQAACL
jgi:hypothetical protein